MKKQLRDIVDLQLTQLKALLAQRELPMTITDKALDLLGEEGFDPQYGARPLKRVIQKEIVNKLSKLILSGEAEKGKSLVIDVKGGVFTFNFS